MAKTKESRRHPHPRARVPAHNANLGATSVPYSQPGHARSTNLVRVAGRDASRLATIGCETVAVAHGSAHEEVGGRCPVLRWVAEAARTACSHLSTGSFASGAQPDCELAFNTNTHVNPLQSEGLGEKHTLVCDVSAAAGGAPAAAAPNPEGENMVASESERGAHCP